jgi:integrase
MANHKRNKKDHHLTKVGNTFYFQANGKKTSLRTTSITEARALRDKIWERMQFEKAGVIDTRGPLFGAVVLEWMEYKKLKDIRKEHIQNLKSRCNTFFLKAPFVNKHINEITPIEIEKWYMKAFKEANISNNYANDVLTILSNIFKFAVRSSYTSANIMTGVERPKSDGFTPNPFSKDDMWKIIEASSEYFRPMITTKFFTGMRVSEIFGLKWEDINFTAREISINRSYLSKEADTKNKHSKRTIKVVSLVIEALREQRKISMGKSEFVFINTKGNPISYKTFGQSTWNKTLVRAGVENKSFRNTRSTFITLALMEGEDIQFVAKYVGHSSIKTIIKHYYGYLPKKDEGLKLAALAESMPEKKEETKVKVAKAM